MAINALIYIKGGEIIDSRSDRYFLKNSVAWTQISFDYIQSQQLIQCRKRNKQRIMYVGSISGSLFIVGS